MDTTTQEMYIVFPVLTLVIGLVLSTYVMPRMLTVSVKNGYDRKGDELGEAKYRTYHIAGLALFPVLLLTLCSSLMSPMVFAETPIAQACFHMVPRVLSLITGSTLLFFVGLKFDLHGASTGVRLLAILLASCIFPLSDMDIDNLHGLFGIDEIPMWLGFILTVIVAAVIIELFRLLDGFDALASGLGVVTVILFSTVYFMRGSITPSLVSGSILGVLLPFWFNKRINNKWTHAMMGNSGSYVLGFIVAYLFICIQRRAGQSYDYGTDILAFSVLMLPLFDIVRVIGSRARDGREILTQDRNQINAKIARMGVPRWGVTIVLIVIPVAYYLVALLMLHMGLSTTPIFIIEVALWFGTQFTINYFINRHRNKTHMAEWDKVYGEDAWNAQVPVEQLEAKQRAFGTMGLPPHIIGNQLEFIPDGMSSFERNLKRIIDLIVATGSLIVFSPLFLLSYVLIKLDDGGPAIYAQERIGRFGRPFHIYKFRSMRLDAEAMGPQLSHAGGDDDPRLTKIGKFLRAHHLDELPQLWNVFTGDMAFIGYRPERKFFIDQIMEHDPRYAFLYQIRPGVTSYATLYNGYTDTMEKMLRRLELDLYYLGHRSFWLDYKVLFLTFTSIVFGKKF